MSVKGWFFDKFFKDSVIHEVYRSIDKKMTSYFPFAWPAFLHSLKGWKTITGIVLIGLTPALTSLAQLLMSAEFAEASELTVFYGSWALLIIGVLHKAVKFIIYEEAIDKDGFMDDESIEKPEWPYNEAGFGALPKHPRQTTTKPDDSDF